jgi:hypothetical protein
MTERHADRLLLRLFERRVQVQIQVSRARHGRSGGGGGANSLVASIMVEPLTGQRLASARARANMPPLANAHPEPFG